MLSVVEAPPTTLSFDFAQDESNHEIYLPLFLLLLLLVPLVVYIGAPSKGASRRRELTSLVLRLIILLCLILSIAGLELVKSGNNLAVVFLMDTSDSMPQQAKVQLSTRQARKGNSNCAGTG